MKCTIPEISWHNRNPVLSLHIQPFREKFYRLATGGSDCHVLIWQLLVNELGAVKIEALADLTRHQRAVNSVRWSPSGQHLATADDDANIIIWQLKMDNIPLLEGETNDKETWTVYKVLRGHKEDIYDLCWSPNGLKLFSGSIDNTAILWDFTKGKSEEILTDHKGFVQGVAWDPKGHYIATISTDRVCRIFDSSGKIKNRIQKGCLRVPEDHYLHNKDVKFFHDDTFRSFFRRLDFSPDGSLLVVPSGRIEIDDCKKILNAALIFAVDSWTGPVALLPSGKQCNTVVRFCPILFEKREDGPEPIFSLPYRMIIAVGTDRDVIIYDTQQPQPFAYFRDINYTRLTDLTWSDDGHLLIASSSDGFCALINFEPDELGVQYVKEESENEESMLDISGCEELDKEDIVEVIKPKKPGLLEQWAVKTPKRDKMASTSSKIEDSSNNVEELNKNGIACKRIQPTPVLDKIQQTPVLDKKSKKEQEDEIKTPPIKRIKPIKLAENKVTPQNKELIGKKQETTPKVTPLLNFLKRSTKKSESAKKTAATTPVVDKYLTLDENEARDAWKCDKDANQTTQQPLIMEVEELTEDFSLHLEDSHSTTNKKTEETAVPDTKNCVQPKEETKLSNSVAIGNVPKRRIPLITLSSPKQKKK